MERIEGVLTLDVEDWYHANFAQLKGKEAAVAESVRSSNYSIKLCTDLWIQTLTEYSAKSTCFVLGEFAERHPDAVLSLAKAGHEIACHGFTHDLIYEMNRENFREFLKKSLGVIGDLVGKTPIGFRAPSWSVDERTPWFCEELERQGIKYDSSIFPIKTNLYGSTASPLVSYKEGNILRIPVTVLSLGPVRIPFASGAFFRLAPLALITAGFKRAAKAGQSVMAVIHPRELDPLHPRLPLHGWENYVHYARLHSTVPKLKRILRQFSWSSVSSHYLLS